MPPLRVLGDALRFIGRTFRLGSSGRIFVWVCEDPLGAGAQESPLRRWLARH